MGWQPHDSWKIFRTGMGQPTSKVQSSKHTPCAVFEMALPAWFNNLSHCANREKGSAWWQPHDSWKIFRTGMGQPTSKVQSSKHTPCAVFEMALPAWFNDLSDCANREKRLGRPINSPKSVPFYWGLGVIGRLLGI